MSSENTTIETLCEQWEAERIIISTEVYNQYAGFQVDEKKRQEAANKVIHIAKEVLRYEDDLHNRLKILALSTISYARSLPLRDILKKIRVEKITHPEYNVKTTDTQVNWTNWRQFSTDSQDRDRKIVYDEFISKAHELGTTVQKILQDAASIYQDYNTNPLSTYFYMENISYDKFHSMLLKLGDTVKSEFLTTSEKYASEVLDKTNLDYYDDYYLMRNKIYRKLDSHFDKITDPVAFTIKHLKAMDFDTSRISIDGEERPGKHPSACCFSISVPSDSRILFKKISPFSDLESVLHEFGHGLHGTIGFADQPFWQRYSVSHSEAETFSIWLESVLEHPSFLVNKLGLLKEAVEDIKTRKRFITLFFVCFYCALSLTKLEYWQKELSVEETSRTFERYTERFYFRIPGKYWLLHHVLPDYLLYAPSYLIAAIRVAELNRYLTIEVGEEWWDQRETAKIISELMAAHGKVDFSNFSKLDTRPYLEDICGIR